MTNQDDQMTGLAPLCVSTLGSFNDRPTRAFFDSGEANQHAYTSFHLASSESTTGTVTEGVRK